AALRGANAGAQRLHAARLRSRVCHGAAPARRRGLSGGRGDATAAAGHRLSRRAEIVPACCAGVVLALAFGATVWSAWPLRGPLGEEFGWSNRALAVAA